jgi:hypothetical protein
MAVARIRALMPALAAVAWTGAARGGRARAGARVWSVFHGAVE